MTLASSWPRTKTWTITRAQLDTEVAAFLRERKKTIQDVPLAQKPMLETDILNNMVIQRLVLAKAATLNLPDVAKMDAATFDQLKSHFPTEAEFQAQLQGGGSDRRGTEKNGFTRGRSSARRWRPRR